MSAGRQQSPLGRAESPHAAPGIDATRLFLGLSLVLSLLALPACDGGAPIVQPIAFSHAVHVDSGLDCSVCHEGAASEPHAGVPASDLCLTCHGGGLTDGAEEAKLLALTEGGEQVPWRRIYQVPDHVYFSHRRHVAIAGLECGECHGEVAALTVPASRPLVDHSMDWCVGCHEARGASTDCIHCHM